MVRAQSLCDPLKNIVCTNDTTAFRVCHKLRAIPSLEL
jgi:hypothetical protein